MANVNIADLSALVVDDYMVNRRDLERMLKAIGCKYIDQASNVAEAHEKMKGILYDIVFLDWNMPGKSGYNLLKTCREDNTYDSVAFVIVSAESEDRYIIGALKAGATSYIVKPVAETTLQDHVTKVLTWIDRRAAKAQQPPEQGTPDGKPDPKM